MMSTLYDSDWTSAATRGQSALPLLQLMDSFSDVGKAEKQAKLSQRTESHRKHVVVPTNLSRRLTGRQIFNPLLSTSSVNHNPMEGLQAMCYRCTACGTKYVISALTPL
jgi:hypothetical protein